MSKPCFGKDDTPADTAGPRAEEDEKLKNFGPWMLVSRRKRQTKPAGSVVPRDDATTSATPDRVEDFSAVQGHDNITQHVYEVSVGAAGPSGVKRYDRKLNHGIAAKRCVAGAIVRSAEDQRRAKFHPNFRYSHVDKGKSKQGSGTGQLYAHGPLETNPKIGEQTTIFNFSEPNLSFVEPVFVFTIPNSNVNSLQSQPSNQNTPSKNNPISFTSPQQTPSSCSTISLRPQLPKSKGGNDKHSVGGVSVVQSISKLVNSTERSVHSDRRRCDRVDPKGSTSCVGLV